MQRFAFLLFCVFAGVFLAHGAEQREMVNINGKNYFMGVEITLAWFDAMEFCNALNMTLASFETSTENQDVATYISTMGYGTMAMWTSGTRVQAGGWIWAGSGQIIQVFSWGPGQPSGAGPQIKSVANDGWFDANGNEQNNFLCE